MKKIIFKALTIGLFISVSACSKSYTCACTESYDGAVEQYSNKTYEEIEGLEKDKAQQQCAQGNVGPQNLYGETWGINCELE
tara:strand:- start:1186 stop:1431 length:246 start_codon:yes stop_codon:yes gene_type:complete